MEESDLPIVLGFGSDRVRSAALHQLQWYAIVYEGPEHRVAALSKAFLGVLGGFNPLCMRAADFLIGSEGQGSSRSSTGPTPGSGHGSTGSARSL